MKKNLLDKSFDDVSVVIEENGDVRFYIEQALCYDYENGNEWEMCVPLGDEKDIRKLIGNLAKALNACQFFNYQRYHADGESEAVDAMERGIVKSEKFAETEREDR